MRRHDRSELAKNVAAVSPGTSSSGCDRSFARWAIVLALTVIALAAVAVYCDSFSGTFVFDDAAWIERDVNIRQLWPIWQVFRPSEVEHTGGRPVVSLTLAVNYALGGTNVWGYHAMNLVIHVLAAWALFGVVRRTLTLPQFREQLGSSAAPLALIVTLLWTVHPLQTESVTYVIQRTEALVGLFYLLTLYCLIRGATAGRSTWWYVVAATACLLGMATKEVMVTAPVVVLLYDRTFLAHSFREALRRRWGLYLALAATWGAVAALLVVSDFHGGTTGFAVKTFTWWSYLSTQPGVIVHYLRLAFWPSGLCFDYGWKAPEAASEVVLPGLLVAGLLALTFWAMVKRPAWGFLGAWFFLILAPTSSFVPIRDAAFEHRMYLSLAAVVAGTVIGVWCGGRRLVRRGTISLRTLQLAGGVLSVCACVALGTLTFQRNALYQSRVSIWEDAAAKAPGNLRAHYNLGVELARCGRTEEAIVEYEKTLEISPYHADTHNSLGFALAKCQRLDEAIVHYRKALAITPDYAGAHYNLGVALAAQGRLDEAIAEYREAIKIKPDLAEAHDDFADALIRCGRIDEAFVHFNKALEIKPDFAKVHFNFGVALANRRQFDEALDHFHKAVEIQPDYAEAHNNLGNTLASLERLDEAIDCFRKAVELKPDYTEAHNNLGIALATRGHFDEAIAHFNKALEINPDYAAARRNLGVTRGLRGNPK
jgi:protein O-mannosyl-transferase